MEQADKERFRQIVAHTDYFTNEKIQQEAQELGVKLWNSEPDGRRKKSRNIQVIYNGKIVMTGTAEEIAKRSTLAKTTIWNLARTNGTDSFGKTYRYVGVVK